MRFSVATIFSICVLLLATIYSCAATPLPIFNWFRRLTSGQDDNNGNDNGNNDNYNGLSSRYGPIKVFVNLGIPGEDRTDSDPILRVPTTAIRTPSPAIIASVPSIRTERERLALLNSGGKVLEATLQFEQSEEQQQQQQQYATLASVLGIRINSRMVIDIEKVMPLKCQFYVGDGFSQAGDGSAGGGWSTVGEVIGLYRPKRINRFVDGVKCFAWIAEGEGEGEGEGEEDETWVISGMQGANVEALLHRYLDGVSDDFGDDDDDDEDDAGD